MLLISVFPAVARQPAIERVQAVMDLLPLSQPPHAYDDLMYGSVAGPNRAAHLPRWIAGDGHDLPNAAERMAYLEMRERPDAYMSLELSGEMTALTSAWASDGAERSQDSEGRFHWRVELPTMHRDGTTRWRADIAPPFILLSSPEVARQAPSTTPAPENSAAALMRAILSGVAAVIDPNEVPYHIAVRFGADRHLFDDDHDRNTLRAAGVPLPLAQAGIFLSDADGTQRALLTWLWPSCDMPATAIAALDQLAPGDDWESTFAPSAGFCQLQFVSPALE